MHLRFVEIEYVSISRVKVPILSLLADFDSLKTHPVISDSEHKAKNQGFKFVIVSEVIYKFVELSLLLVVNY